MSTLTDPVCGMPVRDPHGMLLEHQGRRFAFCSDYCLRAFRTDPERYLHPAATVDDVVRRIAYFSMEVAVDTQVPTYSGGLGVLAGDTLRSCADLRIPIVGVTLLYRHGYFNQKIDAGGNQSEEPVSWNPSDRLRLLPTQIHVNLESHPVLVRAWQYDITGVNGFCVPLLLLDTSDASNRPEHRSITDWLYGGDERNRLQQEIILGIGGVRMLRALGYSHLERFHMNEGHAALMPLELLGEEGSNGNFDAVRSRCIFTTHTPVPAGHDSFPYDLVKSVLTEPIPLEQIQMLAGGNRLNMTSLALNTSHYVNGVAKRHGEVSRGMFPDYRIDSITNGVHSYTWTCAGFRSLFDQYIPGWVTDPLSLRNAVNIPRESIRHAHDLAKFRLIEEVHRRTGKAFSTKAFTIGFARRATPYKRADLIFSDPKQLLALAQEVGPIQILFAGKAHPRDEAGKDVIRQIIRTAAQLDERVKVAYLENYDLALAQLLVSGVDLWLNTPQRPQEASGTSGMKAAHNGVPSLSVPDGWWLEGHLEGMTGWSIGTDPDLPGVNQANADDAVDLYRKLHALIVPTFYHDPDRWASIMRNTIAFNASFFNTHRMVQQYAANAYV